MSPDRIVIRESVGADIPAIHAIYAHHVLVGTAAFEEVPPSLEEMARRRREIVDKGLPYVVAEESGRVVGYGYAATYRPRSAYRFTVEDSVYLEKEAIGHGVGSLLLAALIDRAEGLGKRQMIAIIGDSSNTASVRAHERAGFHVVGVLRNVGLKFGRWLDTVVMQRRLGPGSDSMPDSGS